MEQRLSRFLPPAATACLLGCALGGAMPLRAGMFAVMAVTAALFSLYLAHGIMHTLYGGFALSCLCAGILSFFMTSEMLYPYLSIVFYAGFGAIFGIRAGLFFFRKRPSFADRIDAALHAALCFLYLCACALSFLLAPSFLFIAVPFCVAAVPTPFLGYVASRIARGSGQPAGAAWTLRFPRTVNIAVVMIVSAGTLLVLKGFSNARTAVHSRTSTPAIDASRRAYAANPGAEEALSVASLCIENGDVDSARRWCLIAETLAPGTPLPAALSAVVMGLQAREGGIPWERLNNVGRSIRVLDSLVERFPENPRLRSARMSYYQHLPSLFHASRQLRSDRLYFHDKNDGRTIDR